MSDANLITIWPGSLKGLGEQGLNDVARPPGNTLHRAICGSLLGLFRLVTTNLLKQMVLSRSSLAVSCARPGTKRARMTNTASDRAFLILLHGNTEWRWDAIVCDGGIRA